LEESQKSGKSGDEELAVPLGNISFEGSKSAAACRLSSLMSSVFSGLKLNLNMALILSFKPDACHMAILKCK